MTLKERANFSKLEEYLQVLKQLFAAVQIRKLDTTIDEALLREAEQCFEQWRKGASKHEQAAASSNLPDSLNEAIKTAIAKYATPASGALVTGATLVGGAMALNWGLPLIAATALVGGVAGAVGVPKVGEYGAKLWSLMRPSNTSENDLRGKEIERLISHLYTLQSIENTFISDEQLNLIKLAGDIKYLLEDIYQRDETLKTEQPSIQQAIITIQELDELAKQARLEQLAQIDKRALLNMSSVLNLSGNYLDVPGIASSSLEQIFMPHKDLLEKIQQFNQEISRLEEISIYSYVEIPLESVQGYLTIKAKMTKNKHLIAKLTKALSELKQVQYNINADRAALNDLKVIPVESSRRDLYDGLLNYFCQQSAADIKKLKQLQNQLEKVDDERLIIPVSLSKAIEAKLSIANKMQFATEWFFNSPRLEKLTAEKNAVGAQFAVLNETLASYLDGLEEASNVICAETTVKAIKDELCTFLSKIKKVIDLYASRILSSKFSLKSFDIDIRIQGIEQDLLKLKKENEQLELKSVKELEYYKKMLPKIHQDNMSNDREKWHQALKTAFDIELATRLSERSLEEVADRLFIRKLYQRVSARYAALNAILIKVDDYKKRLASSASSIVEKGVHTFATVTAATWGLFGTSKKAPQEEKIYEKAEKELQALIKEALEKGVPVTDLLNRDTMDLKEKIYIVFCINSYILKSPHIEAAKILADLKQFFKTPVINSIINAHPHSVDEVASIVVNKLTAMVNELTAAVSESNCEQLRGHSSKTSCQQLKEDILQLIKETDLASPISGRRSNLVLAPSGV